MSALFSALCLACAAFARSTKEGQYYLMPLLLVTMPLMMLPMSPGIELNLGNSLIPITGVVLLLRALVEGNYGDALPYVIPVCGTSLICCLLAIRWAVYQFNQESVLFRESERLDLRRWIVHLVRDRQDTPSVAEAFFCVALIFVIQFFTRLAISAHIPKDPDFSFLAQLLFISQVVCIALPALLMTVLFTDRPRRTLLLDRAPGLAACAAAVGLAFLLHPVGHRFVEWIQYIYPIQDELVAETQSIGRMMAECPLRVAAVFDDGGAAGDLRGAGLSRLHSVRPEAAGTQVVGDRAVGRVLRHGPYGRATVHRCRGTWAP